VNRITNLQILDEFGEYGLYWCKFKGTPRLFTTNHAVTKVLIHYADYDALEVVRDDVAGPDVLDVFYEENGFPSGLRQPGPLWRLGGWK